MKKILLTALSLCLLFTTTTVCGSGFNLYEHGAKGTSMGGAFTARSDDASAVFFNAASLAHLEGWNIYVGGSLIMPAVKFAGTDSFPGYGVEEETATRMFFPPAFYLAKRVNDRIGVGAGLYAPFAIGTEWDGDDFSGRYISKLTELAGIYFTPAIGVKINDRFSVGGSINFVHSVLELRRVQTQTFNDHVWDVADLKITGDNGVAVSFDVSARAQLHPKVRAGLVYRHKVTNTYEGGEAKFTQILTGISALDMAVANGLPRNTDGKHTIGIGTEVTFPWQITGGLMFQPNDKLFLEFDVIFWGWSEFDELPFDFQGEKEEGDVNTPDNALTVEDYEDSIQLRFGMEYLATEKLAVRAGYVYDESPVPDKSVSVLLPDADRNDFSFGVGYKIGAYDLDLGYMLVDFKERSTNGKSNDNYNGTYQSIAHIYTLGLGYSF
ncbi:MAG: hypothetical protein B6244_04015 [Candidatus Cloacimonetes bacterium 4572_55]|nr:MAG: hypothetical protein B6244_04015 [Candidatus Cloacimonetes bacterium 4572_55]